MNPQCLSAILFIVVFVTVILGVLANTPGLYATQDINARHQIIKANKTRWLVNQALTFLYISLTVIGFAVLASILRKTGSVWILTLASVFVMAGSISGAYFIFLQTIDPRGGCSGAYPLAEHLAWLSDGWYSPCLWNCFSLHRAGFLPPFLLAILNMVIGIVLLRRKIVVT